MNVAQLRAVLSDLPGELLIQIDTIRHECQAHSVDRCAGVLIIGAVSNASDYTENLYDENEPEPAGGAPWPRSPSAPI